MKRTETYGRPLFLLILLAITPMLVGCENSIESNVIMLNDNDNGKQVNTTIKQRLVISLGSNPTTGFAWEPVEYDKTVLEQEGEPRYDPDASNMTGTGGTQVFTFKAIGAGQTTLKLIYHRTFEKDVPPADTFTTTVIVK